MSVAAESVPNEYIVVFKQHVAEDVCQEHCEWVQGAHVESLATRDGGDEVTGLGEQFSFPTLNAYVGSFDASLKDVIEAREEVITPPIHSFAKRTLTIVVKVDFVEPNYVVRASGLVTQNDVPSWGLSRISNNVKVTSATKDYCYESSAGEGTTGYIIDTGIRATHQDFGGRATFGYNAVAGSTNTDKAGHGTHVAGTIGGTKYGVAKKASLIGVKVLGDNGSGSTAGVISGLQWAANDAQKKGIIKKSVGACSQRR
jgi:oryzin